MTRARPRRSDCPISIALELLGDAWSLLVVRDLMFKRLRTFNDFLDAGEGIATNILAERLGRLEEAGIITKRQDPSDRRRQFYRLTAKGMDLAPVIVDLVVWSAQHERTAAPPEQVRDMRDRRAQFLRTLRADWRREHEAAPAPRRVPRSSRKA